MFQHPDTLWSGMLRPQHQKENRGRMRAGGRSGEAPAKHELPVPVKRVESVVREIHPGILRFSSRFEWLSMPIITTMPRIVTGCESVRAQLRHGKRRLRTRATYDNILHFPSGVPATDVAPITLALLLRRPRSAHPTNVHLCRSIAAACELQRDFDVRTRAYLSAVDRSTYFVFCS